VHEDADLELAPTPQRSSTERDPLAEAQRLIALADSQGLQLRLMGGLAFHALCPDWSAPVERDRRDIDVATRGRDVKAVSELLVQQGYAPDRRHNALYGHKQLYFVDPAWARPVDVLVDRLEMCHRFDFADRLAIRRDTLAPADLLLSKLQIVKINRKDILDALALLSEYPLAADDLGGSAISIARITSLTASDWGWWRTATGNLDRLAGFIASDLGAGDLDFGRKPGFEAAAQVETLRQAIDAAPKSTRWRLRARIGERAPWYDLPEEVGHGID
jgi:hypothetical protein